MRYECDPASKGSGTVRTGGWTLYGHWCFEGYAFCLQMSMITVCDEFHESCVMSNDQCYEQGVLKLLCDAIDT